MIFANAVGVAPGTTTMQIAGRSSGRWRSGGLRDVYYSPYTDIIKLKGLGVVDTRAHIRWDVIGLIGGGSLIITLMAGLIASAFAK